MLAVTTVTDPQLKNRISNQGKRDELEALFELLKSNNPKGIKYAEKRIIELGENAISPLVLGLSNQDISIRQNSSRILANQQCIKNIDLESTISILVKMLNDESPEVVSNLRKMLVFMQ